jgi:hypothetical protein
MNNEKKKRNEVNLGGEKCGVGVKKKKNNK